jgi:hypothetical protein
MALSKDQIYLYGAVGLDYTNALTVAADFGLPAGHVLGSFANAWTAVASGKFLVIAIGTPANNALYYNPCGFSGYTEGYTPFAYDTGVRDTLPAANIYMNAAGSTGNDSADLAYNYVYYALNGNCNGCYSGVSPVGASSTCNARNPSSQYAVDFGIQVGSNDTKCGTSNVCAGVNTKFVCTGVSCPALSTIESTATDAGWDPEAIAESVLALMAGMGVDLLGMDKYMAVAAMEGQGCYNCPCSCTGYLGSCDCASPDTNEGFGVLQDNWTGSTLSNAGAALDQVSSHGQSTGVWFPYGITPCTVVADPGTAFAEFYWYALSVNNNNCGTIGEWVGTPCSLACCAMQAYADQVNNGITCSISSCSC